MSAFVRKKKDQLLNITLGSLLLTLKKHFCLLNMYGVSLLEHKFPVPKYHK